MMSSRDHSSVIQDSSSQRKSDLSVKPLSAGTSTASTEVISSSAATDIAVARDDASGKNAYVVASPS